jgi:hypothetical protein
MFEQEKEKAVVELRAAEEYEKFQQKVGAALALSCSLEWSWLSGGVGRSSTRRARGCYRSMGPSWPGICPRSAQALGECRLSSLSSLTLSDWFGPQGVVKNEDEAQIIRHYLRNSS